ncbi:DDE-type integrase/transposase/recombinase [Citrobacter freundii]|nr:DDE-type integrase/transposase/recombinase [Citrobacter freundii]MBC6508324.1 DDE-type integrase/transposase/recombinase [Citrobacter freundii]
MYVTISELTGIPGLPTTQQGLRYSLKKISGNSPDLVRKRSGSKAFEYHIDCLPLDVQKVLRARKVKSMMATQGDDTQHVTIALPESRGAGESKISVFRKCPALMEEKLGSLTAAQRQTADARMALVSEVVRLGQLPGYSCAKAVREIVRQAQAGELPQRLTGAVAAANAKKGSSRALSEISLKRWLADYNKAATVPERILLLAPGKRQPVTPDQIAWLPEFLKHYRKPNGVLMTEAYEDFVAEWCHRFAGDRAMQLAVPSFEMVRYAMNKLPEVVKQHGRITGSEARQLEGFVRRDWLSLPVNYVWIGDGHGMKMKVAHPDHGNPFSPEVTFIMDGSCRYIVGWSLALSESVIAVADALRHGIKNHGKPYIYYSDNGGGETNNTFDADLTGILPRNGIDHRLGIPENPQGRGIIEILNKTLGMRISRKFATYYGTGADKSTTRRMGKRLRAALNAVDKGYELTAQHQDTLRKFPSWDELIAEIENGVDWYNNRPHQSLPKKGNGEHFSPSQYRRYKLEKEKTELEYLSDMELRLMFMPQIERTVSRCEVRLFNNFYYSDALRDEHNRQVLVNYDIHDASKVTVCRMDGSVICDAVWGGNKELAFPISAEYYQRQQRLKGMRKRGEERIRLAEAENVQTIAAPSETEHELLRGNVYRPKAGAVRIHVTDDVEDAEYVDDDFLNNSLDVLESNKRKNVI